MLAPVGAEAFGIGAEGCLWSELQKASGKASEEERFRSRLRKPLTRDQYPEFITHRPQPLVEQPVRVPAQRQPVVGLVVPAAGERTNVSGLHDRGSVGGEQNFQRGNASGQECLHRRDGKIAEKRDKSLELLCVHPDSAVPKSMTQIPKLYERSSGRSGNPDPRNSRLMRRRPLPLRPVRIQPRQLPQPFLRGSIHAPSILEQSTLM